MTKLTRFKKLLEPGIINQIAIRNRIVMLAMGTNFAMEEGYVTERLRAYYGERAREILEPIIMEIVCVQLPAGKGI